MSNPHFESITLPTAKAVMDAIEDSGRTKKEISEITGIPYATLNRKLSAKTDFSFCELLELADALEITPSQFVPPVFRQT